MESPPADTAVFVGTVESTETPYLPTMPATLREVRSSRSPAYERLVFDFGAEPLPGYRIGYVPAPAQDCGSGADVPLAGSSVLSIRFQPAQAHSETRGNMQATAEPRNRALRYPMVRQLRLTCDFEGTVEWALGLSVRGRYRVLRLEKPTRLVLDIQPTTP